MTTQDYDFWERRLAGEPISEKLQAHDGEPQCGFYRVRLSKEKTNWSRVSYYLEGDVMLCQVDDRLVEEQRGRELWPRACQHPISYETFTAVRGGANWPDLHDAASADRRNAPANLDEDSYENLKDRIGDLSREADRLIKKGAAQTQAEADRASDLANRLSELQTKANAGRVKEKKPHDDAAKAVQTKWMPMIDTAEIYRRIKAAVVTPFLAAEDRKRQQAEAAARAAAVQAVKDGQDPPPAAEPPRPVKAGSSGRRSVALRTVKDVAIEDRAKVLAYFADGQAMTEFLQNMAERAVRAGVSVPGTTVTERKVAA